MLSTIGLAAARQVRVAGRLSIRRGSHLVTHLSSRTTTAIPSGIRVAAVFARGYAEHVGPKKTSATAKPAKTTTAAKPKKEKTAKKTKAPVVKAKKARAKKPLTEEQQVKLKIRALRAKALLKEVVPSLPSTPWVVYFTQHAKEDMQGRKKDASLTEFMKDLMARLSSSFAALSAAELEELHTTAERNKLANQVAYKNWVDSYTPQEINAANNARLLLKRVYNKKSKRQIQDPRFPKQPLTSYAAFVQARWQSGAVVGDAKVQMTNLSAEWKKLSPEERKPYEDISATDSERYKKEMLAINAAKA